MGKNSRKNKIWNAQQKKKQNETKCENSQELENKFQSKKKANYKMTTKIKKEMKNEYVKTFGHTTEDISDKEIDLDKQVDNFVKNVKFWDSHVKSIDETKKLTPYEINKRTFCMQAKTHILKQLPLFPESIQKKIMGEMIF
jgi:hypothetical protein